MSAKHLGHFHGGLHLDEHKRESTGAPIRVLPPGRLFVLPLHQHIGHDAEPVVEVGQQVGKGQLIAQPFGDISAAIHAPTSGTVVAIEKRPAPHPSALTVPCIVIEADGEDRWAEGLPAPVDDYHRLDKPKLVELILSGNRLTAIVPGAFEGCTAMNSLDLGDNRITLVPASAFAEMPMLEWANLDNNAIGQHKPTAGSHFFGPEVGPFVTSRTTCPPL